ncbi:probable WRKY transcription factor 32 isoform X2 [Gastrolobium bilobum]|uniref:probable WRKY transcription factor 32 isoform X2 n=1 Tax=Gastrolobium bilobum TaxID=150636 RepID=UPI002AB29399|nr:probable WRKY transcription factor 32 isoform X2 [Gastrolobium bilobum]
MAEHLSSEALPGGAPELHRKGEDSERNGEEVEEKAGEIKERVGESPPATESQCGELQSSNEPTTESNLETLASAVPSSVESLVVQHRIADLQESSTMLNSCGKAESKTVGPPEKETIAREAVQEPPTPIENQRQVSMCSTPLSELSPTSVTQSLSSVPSPTAPKQKMSPPKVNDMHVPEVVKNVPSGGKTLSAVSVPRSSASDGYNWRKYGQKQVKSPTGSRSYYRCTHSDCSAKKIECCDHSGHMTEIVYKSEHSHDPPKRTHSIRESKFVSSNEPTVENSVPEKPIRALPIRVLQDSDPSISSKEPLQEAPCCADKKRQNSSNISDDSKVILKEEPVNEPEPKRRMKKGDLTDLDSAVKPGKKAKFVVHAAGDVGISGDGYRWRKYGQKMVKGNPHPRNYYRCTSAGCPVRKHIESAIDNSNAVIITYKGVHDHDMPVPKKRHGPPSAPLVAAAAPTSMNNLQLKKPDSPQNQKISTQWSVDTEGELTGEALDLGGEKAMESARTLLSIGFEIKPC